MKLLYIILLLGSIASFGQDTYTTGKVVSTMINQAESFNAQQGQRKFTITEYWPGTDSIKAKYLVTKVIYLKDGATSTIYAPGDTARLFFPDPNAPTNGRTLKGTVTWKYADQQFDTTYTEKERIDDPSTSNRWTITNMFKAVNPNKVEPLFNKSFSAVNVVSQASYAEIKLIGVGRIELFSEHFQGHGYVKVFVDGQQIKTLYQGSQFVDCNCYNTDFARMKPSWGMSLPIGDHTLKLVTDAGNQYVIDMVRTFTYTLKPR